MSPETTKAPDKNAQRTIARAKARHRRMKRKVDAIATERAAIEKAKAR
jgi:hypothetical protein